MFRPLQEIRVHLPRVRRDSDYRQLLNSASSLKSITSSLMKTGLLGQFSVAEEQPLPIAKLRVLAAETERSREGWRTPLSLSGHAGTQFYPLRGFPPCNNIIFVASPAWAHIKWVSDWRMKNQSINKIGPCEKTTEAMYKENLLRNKTLAFCLPYRGSKPRRTACALFMPRYPMECLL